MPKPARGGQRTQWATAYARQPQPAPPPAQDDDDDIANMFGYADEEEETVDVKSAEDAPDPKDIVDDEAKLNHDDVDWDNKNFPYLTRAEYDQVYQDNRDSYYKNGNIMNAKKMYESPNAKPNTGGYSYSQDMNHRLNAGLKLDADSKFMEKYLTQGLHPIGKDCTLVRGAHDTLVNQVLKANGFSQNYDQLSASQLKTALVGTQFQTKAFGSWGANNQTNPFIGGSNAGGREVIIYARTAGTTKVIAGARSQDEFITGIGQNAKITDVKFTGGTAFTRSGQTKKVIELFVDMW